MRVIGLYLIAAHLVGDFVLQTRWQAAGKFGSDLHSRALRTRHVAAYTAVFVPVAAVAAPSLEQAVVFLGALYLLHWLTDSRRFRSTLGDVVAWYVGGAAGPAEKRGVHAAMGAPLTEFALPPNPWSPAPILIDQALHVAQFAVLGGLLLS